MEAVEKWLRAHRLLRGIMARMAASAGETQRGPLSTRPRRVRILREPPSAVRGNNSRTAEGKTHPPYLTRNHENPGWSLAGDRLPYCDEPGTLFTLPGIFSFGFP